MSGKMCTGKPTANAFLPMESKAYCAGGLYRSQGTAALFPVANNPNQPDSPDADAWDRGWNVVDSQAGGVVDPDAMPCCATPLTTIAA